jgi:hypothetical protein
MILVTTIDAVIYANTCSTYKGCELFDDYLNANGLVMGTVPLDRLGIIPASKLDSNVVVAYEDVSQGDINVDNIIVNGVANIRGVLYAYSTFYSYKSPNYFITLLPDTDFDLAFKRQAVSVAGFFTDYNFNQFVVGVQNFVGNQLILAPVAYQNFDYKHPTQINPTFYIHSATSPITDENQYLSLTHDTTKGYIKSGKGLIDFDDENLSTTGSITLGGGSANKVVCWVNGTQLGYCSSVVGVDGSCTCN